MHIPEVGAQDTSGAVGRFRRGGDCSDGGGSGLAAGEGRRGYRSGGGETYGEVFTYAYVMNLS